MYKKFRGAARKLRDDIIDNPILTKCALRMKVRTSYEDTHMNRKKTGKMKIVDLHFCGCPIGHGDLLPSWSLKTKIFIVFDVRFFQTELPFISTRSVLYATSNLKVSFVGTFRIPPLC